MSSTAKFKIKAREKQKLIKENDEDDKKQEIAMDKVGELISTYMNSEY